MHVLNGMQSREQGLGCVINYVHALYRTDKRVVQRKTCSSWNKMEVIESISHTAGGQRIEYARYSIVNGHHKVDGKQNHAIWI